jgi:YihY family inner membrane protein
MLHQPDLRDQPRLGHKFVDVWAAALFATILLQAVDGLFVIYLKRFATLNAVYGVFGGIMALLLWIYLCGCVFIFGACLCASKVEAFGQPALASAPTVFESIQAMTK